MLKILGPPNKTAGSDDNYSWGFTAYNNGRLDQIDYKFKARASSAKEALARVGLEETSSPGKGPRSYYWNSSTGPLICCGFEMDNVVISADFSGISIGFKASSPTKAVQSKKQSETADPKKIEELSLRIAYAKFLTSYFASIGRQQIHVSAIDENQQTLDVFSVAIGKPFGSETHNLISAREVVQSADSRAVMKKYRFKKIVIRGTDYAEAYAIP